VSSIDEDVGTSVVSCVREDEVTYSVPNAVVITLNAITFGVLMMDRIRIVEAIVLGFSVVIE
jgi:hypothetical protein